ncbi:MAG: endonuclease domain-containing protein [Planctomycetota bacterium]|nr:endonuclease domain-containing protein [Planctomycetota bacterium]MDA0918232.1 endonuclease domain-containing protein [Planctomycetota bacterium]MDA1158218.1 endonuclease domain-containing protein [Planctomycetota bacterium]
MPHRRELRERSTKAEQLIWAVVRNRRLAGLKFRRQHSVGYYIADFACLDPRLIIELDGEYHRATEEADATRQQFLETAGFKVLRFANSDVLENVEGVAVAILKALDLPPHPNPLPPNDANL